MFVIFSGNCGSHTYDIRSFLLDFVTTSLVCPAKQRNHLRIIFPAQPVVNTKDEAVFNERLGKRPWPYA